MSDTPRMKGAKLPEQPALAHMLVAALNEHEAALGRVSRLLHDDVSQVLSAVGLQLDAMRMDFRELAPGLDGRAAEIQAMLEQAIEQLRDLSNELSPSIVERAGLQFALDRLIGRARKTFIGTLRLHFDSNTRVPTTVAKTLYKIAECALDLALARPECSSVEIQVKRSRGEFVLEVSDNGKLDNNESSVQSLAQMVMDYYASRGRVVLQPPASTENGNIVRATCPIEDEEKGG